MVVFVPLGTRDRVLAGDGIHSEIIILENEGRGKSCFPLNILKEELTVTGIKRVFKVHGKPFFPLGGQAGDASAYNKVDTELAFQAIKLLHGNTLSIGVYWEIIEPTEGKFDFTLIDNLLASARRHNLKLILDWFATWKCGNMDYAPDWVKTNPRRFRRVIAPTGMALFTLSPHCQANFEADKKAFTALCNHLKVKDSSEQTVIGIQVENESGILGSDRDYGPEAQAVFDSPVPAKLVAAMKTAGKGRVYDLWQQAGGKKSGTWPELFGWSAGELMSAWSVATYHDGLAEAGKAIYNIPMYINAWTMESVRPEFRWMTPGECYPSGGPVTKVLDIYKWFTPHIDLIAPDIYVLVGSRFDSTLAAYAFDGNPLFMPESSGDPPPELFRAIADYNLIGFFIMGSLECLVAEDGSLNPQSRIGVDTIRCVAAAIPLLLKYQGTGKVQAVIQEGFELAQVLDMDGYLGSILFGEGAAAFASKDWRYSKPMPELSPERPPIKRGYGLVIQASKNEFYLVGSNYQLFLRPKLPPEKMLDATFLSEWMQFSLNHPNRIDEGHFDQNGKFIVDRHRNGGSICSGVWVESDTGVVRVITGD